MKRQFRPPVSVSLAVLICAVPILWWNTGYLRGRIAAKFDIERGVYRELEAGLPPNSFFEYQRVLRDRYGIEHVRVAGCVVGRTTIDYIRGYNAVARAAAKRKFGKDIFDEAQMAAVAMRRDSAPRQP